MGTLYNQGEAFTYESYPSSSSSSGTSSSTAAPAPTARAGTTIKRPYGLIDAALTNSGVTNASSNADGFWLAAKIMPFDFTSDLLNMEVAGAAPGALAKIVIYDADQSTGLPTDLLYESPDFDCSTAGEKGVLAALNFVGGRMYWLGLRTNISALIPRGIYNGSAGYLGRGSIGGSAAGTIYRQLAYATATPSPYGAVEASYLNSGNTPPVVGVRVGPQG